VYHVSDNYKLYNVILVIRDTLGSHIGANITDQLFDALRDHQISSNQIAYFPADNASNNDIALAELLKRIILDLVISRSYCASYIYNLVYTAILFRVDKDALDNT
jgi:hypothetical protein